MKLNYMLICISLLTAFCIETAFAGDFTVDLYSHETQGGYTNIWRVSSNIIAKVPTWKVETEPPLSLTEAVKIAKKWCTSMGASQQLWLDNVVIRAVVPGTKEYGDIYYYNICFGGVGYVGHYLRCIVLMDGTVVRPEWLGVKPEKVEGVDYDE